MTTELDFLSGISIKLSDILWREAELPKKIRMIEELHTEIRKRVLDLLPPGTVLMA